MGKKLEPTLFLQTDKRWCDNDYSAKGEKTTIKAEGCGIACSAMVIASLADKKVTPVDTAAWSLKNGYKAPHQGTYYAYFKPQMAEYGIECNMMNSKNCYGNPKAEVHERAKQELKKQNWLIAVMGKGDWTSSGHYIVVYALDGNNVLIKDPYNTKAKCLKASWDVFSKQVKYYWSIEVPEKFKEEEELVVQSMIEIDGNESTVSMIYKDNRAYVSVRELATLLKYDVSSNGKVPVLKKKDR